MLAQNGALADLIDCGRPDSGMRVRPLHRHGPVPELQGHFPAHLQPQLRRPFSGTADGQIYLVSPETAAASALTGVFHRPADAG